YAAFLTDIEGDPLYDDGSDDDDDSETGDPDDQYFAASYLMDQAFRHRLNPQQILKDEDIGQHDRNQPQQFFLDRYDRARFQGILPDTGAANSSTAGKGQFLALQREDPSVRLDEKE